MFIVTTPTAVITDLGTEFGVEVDQAGLATAHVFRGSIGMQVISAGGKLAGDIEVLHAGESARTATNSGDDRTIMLCRVNVEPASFVRRISTAPKTINLLDIVAGSYKTTGRRERGIDPTTGMEDPLYWPEGRIGSKDYHPVAWHKLIDGVFVPNGGDGPVVVDSAGHAFDGFPRTSGMAFGSIWARAATVKPDGREKDYHYWVYAMGSGEQFMPNNSGLLALASNAGITFDLEAMRVTYRGAQPSRFRAVLGLADDDILSPPADPDVVQLADVWVLVDGQLRLSRPHLCPEDGPVAVDIALDPKDRFLTLATTYDGSPRNNDWVVFGDPVLEMTAAEPPSSETGRKEAR